MNSKFQHPADIQLPQNPLVEAWLEIKWELISTSAIPGELTDPMYRFAMGNFYTSVRNVFSFLEELPTSKAPEGFLPHIPQIRFRTEKDGWPLLQLGPGVATVNFTKTYNWSTFKEKALFLREKLVSAYLDNELKTKETILRYRNAYPFDYFSEDLFEFIEKRLNSSISLPQGIPGHIGKKQFPSSFNSIIKFDLQEPNGTGQITIGTGSRADPNEKGKQNKVIVWELEMASKGQDAPDLGDEASYINWLEGAHSVLHEWFFTLIDGELRTEFSKGK
jgi:uncharacterized protein (TIGR04255 family)